MSLSDPASHMSWQQLLAAYADGELDQTTRRRLQSWLDAHQSARRELNSQLAFSPRRQQFWNELEPTLPSAAAWAGVWERIELSLELPRAESKIADRRIWRKRKYQVGALAACAAVVAVVAVCLSGRESAPSAVQPAVDESAPEVFEVAAAGDVEILSVRDSDVTSLLVGVPPLCGNMTLVARSDVRFEGSGSAADVSAPEVQSSGPTDGPLVYAPKSRVP
jgi:hypothetical protein